MRKYILYFLILLSVINPVFCEETKYILHDRCINLLYKPAVSYFKESGIFVLRDSRGIIIRFELKNPLGEYSALSAQTVAYLNMIEYFLAKIKNAVIIEVHVADIPGELNGLKKWEISAVIAGKVENIICNKSNLLKDRIHTVGYGEFLPENNTPNNGGKLLNRIDIIVLCNISGE